MQVVIDWLPPLLAGLLTGYLAGSVPYGYLFGRIKGLDIREHGSGNIGATNVWRVMGRYWGMTAFALDFLKVPLAGVVYAFVIKPLLPLYDRGGILAAIPVAIFLGAVIGHNFPVWLKFKGGKGIATTAGGLLWLMPKTFLLVIAVWIVSFVPFRIVSLASIIAGLALPVATWFFYPGMPLWFWISCFLSVMAIWRHRANIQRLMNGTEHRWTRTQPKIENPNPWSP
jgi:glycerol-3-phosphate acyltransferase PlsY